MTASGTWEAVDRVLDDAVAAGGFPGAQLLVGRGDEIVHESVHGSLAFAEPAVTADTLYDVSSLTKPLVTKAVLLRRIARGELALDTAIVDVVPDFAAAAGDDLDARRSLTVANLLAHDSGLPARRLYFRRLEDEAPREMHTRAGKRRIEAMAFAEPLEREPRTTAVYSDIGFIVLGALLERIAVASLDVLARDEIFAPLGLRSARFIDLERADETATAAIAPCGACGWRKTVVRGVVQDENAYAMAGVAGHAGLFSNARDLHRIVAEYVRAHAGEPSLFETELVRRCWTTRAAGGPAGAPPPSWVLGWDTPTPGASSAGRSVSATAVGHLGFTGTSIWIDPERGVHVLLLTNRVHPDRDNTAIREIRPRVHDAVFGVVD